MVRVGKFTKAGSLAEFTGPGAIDEERFEAVPVKARVNASTRVGPTPVLPQDAKPEEPASPPFAKIVPLPST